MELSGTHVLITGASRGIGAAMAKNFAAEGAIVSLVARSAGPITELAKELGGYAFPTDLLDNDQLDGLVKTVEAKAGPVDVLVCNAGIESTEYLINTEAQDIRDLARTNLEVPMVLTRHALGPMFQRNRGHLVFVSSLAGTSGFPGQAAYGATKSGLTNFAASIRLETRDTDINVTVVSPGPVNTTMWDGLTETPHLSPVLKRLNQLKLIPKVEPEHIAARTVSAVQEDRRHVRTPKRLTAQFWLNEAPRRMTESLLAGVKTGPSVAFNPAIDLTSSGSSNEAAADKAESTTKR